MRILGNKGVLTLVTALVFAQFFEYLYYKFVLVNTKEVVQYK